MIKKIILVLILLTFIVISNAFCEERTIVYVHVTEGTYGFAPDEGDVWLHCYGISFRPDYHGPDTYPFPNVCGLSFNHYATAAVEAGEYYDEQTHMLTIYNNHFYLYLADGLPEPPPDDPPGN